MSAFAFSAALAASIAWGLMTREHSRQKELLAELVSSHNLRKKQEVSVPKNGADIAPSLPKFTSEKFAKQFNEVAAGVSLPVEEVSYVLESDEGKPYLRYRATMTVKTRYLEVRKFIAALANEMPHVSLDTVHCARENAMAAPLSCQLAFSAFFAKG